MSDECFDDTYVSSGRRNRGFFSGWPKCAGPVRDESFTDTYIREFCRRNRVIFSGLPKCAGPVRDDFSTTHT